MMPALELENVSQRVSGTFGLRDLSLAVEVGQCLGLIGPSGAGKTTTLRLIAGLEGPDAGTIRIDGKVVSQGALRVSPHRRRVGLVFQGLALWPHVTVAKHVHYGLDQELPRANCPAKVQEILERLDLVEHARRYPSELSGGEQQRVALARALAGRPRILLLDEPLANLDRSLRRDLLELLVGLKTRESVSMVFVSHDREGLSSLTDSLVVMDRGEIVEQGPTNELLASPESAAGRRLLAD
jgi:ABC-type Fe3+/spermidine/putrescine transport system ATPase subunit